MKTNIFKIPGQLFAIWLMTFWTAPAVMLAFSKLMTLLPTTEIIIH